MPALLDCRLLTSHHTNPPIIEQRECLDAMFAMIDCL